MLKRPRYFFATLVLFRKVIFQACMLSMLSFGSSFSLANPTERQEIKKIKPQVSDSTPNSLELEKRETISPSEVKRDSSLNSSLSRPHLVRDHYNLGLAVKLGKFYKDQEELTSFGGYFSGTKILDIQRAFDLNISVFTTGWWQVLLGQRTYFNDTPYFRPFYGFEVGTQIHPKEKIGSLIVYERYSLGAKIGLEAVYREFYYHIEGEAMASLSGVNFQTNMSVQKAF